jgi:hypothetical protein
MMINTGNFINLNKTGSIMDFATIEDSNVNYKITKVVTLSELFTVVGEDGPVHLKVTITTDFNEIPEKYHEIFLNVLTAKYINKVNFGSNLFSECQPVIKRKWWEFWKKEYFTR